MVNSLMGFCLFDQRITRWITISDPKLKQAKLAFLKQIVWPEIMALAKTEIARYEEEAKNETNEVWMTFAPESEALSGTMWH